AKADSPEALLRCWDEAVQAGEIPSAYWAILTHPAVNDSLTRLAFGAVHMLSHLVGAANRADIRKLHRLEAEKSALEETVARQQAQLRDGIQARDAQIRELSSALSREIERRVALVNPEEPSDPQSSTLESLVVRLRRERDAAIRRSDRAEKRAAE